MGGGQAPAAGGGKGRAVLGLSLDLAVTKLAAGDCRDRPEDKGNEGRGQGWTLWALWGCGY